MIEDIFQERLKKRRPEHYPAAINKSHAVGEAIEGFVNLVKNKKKIVIAGRIMGLRVQGGLIFCDVQDNSGKIQVVIKKDNLKNFSDLKDSIDIGDFIEVGGPLFKTARGEKSVEARSARLITKSLRPLPSVWHGLKDVEERFRKRYLDLLLNPGVKEAIVQRSKIIEDLRESLYKEGFLEVETPMLQPIPGGAVARPFKTYHNALDMDLYLRIAPELYLKRLLVGGFEKIFEIGRNFRNEGVDRDHNPEFTALELYWANQDYSGLIKFTKKLLKKWLGSSWATTTFADLFYKHTNEKHDSMPTAKMEDMYKKIVRPKVVKPTFVTNYPEPIMPLAKLMTDDESLTESFQLVVNGVEIIKAFSEQNDPVIQREQMKRQEKEFRAGNEEASRLDEDFLEALEYGMPPAAGMGIGIDRLVALVTKSHAVKEIIAFPTLKPKE
ncbi:MAG: amino acid--tRNA ligase-related protein [bacterium]|nr:amino acid--tRNA ligase-related protein [bacterium]